MVVTMYIQRNIKKTKIKNYKSFLLVHNERINGKVKHNILANLSKLPEELINEFEKIIKGENKKSLSEITDKNFYQEQGKTYGGIKIIHEISKECGLSKSLGKSKESILSLIMLSGIILSQKKSKNYIANYWNKDQAIEEVFDYSKYYNEDDFYETLKWLSKNQEKIEKKMWKCNKSNPLKKLFLYDITSSYVEGEKIELSCYGYNRDKKKGKKQIVIGLLTDDEGTPVSVEVFDGNTRDFNTVSNQLTKIKNIFGVKDVVFIGDRGMVKSQQIEEITKKNWSYITCITKPQIEKLLKEEVFQMSLFDNKLCEIENKEVRYILRKNPFRETEIIQSLKNKIKFIALKTVQQNKYLSSHKRAKSETAVNKIDKILNKLKLTKLIEILTIKNKIVLKINKEKKEEILKLAGCYVLITNLSKKEFSKSEINKKYKTLIKVENDFKTLKTGFLEIRPLFLRKEEQIRGHVFLCVLALKIVRYIENLVKDLKLPLEYVWQKLETIKYINNVYKTEKFKTIPKIIDKDLKFILGKLSVIIPSKL
jgi:transposase